jgi:hypothetical protein
LIARPVVTITSPLSNVKFKGGTELDFIAVANDPNEALLKKNSFRWQVNYRHDDHWHDNWSYLNGDSIFNYTFAPFGDVSSTVFFRFRVIATNSADESDTADVDIYPYFSTFTITSSPVGAQFQLGTGMVVTTPSVLSAPENYNFSLSNYLRVQTINGIAHTFRQWNFCSTVSSVFFNVPQGDTLITMYFEEGETTTTGLLFECNSNTSTGTNTGVNTSPGNNTTVTGIENTLENKNITIYPIPSDRQINVSTKNNEPIKQINILNLLGREMIGISFESYKTSEEVDISSLPSGTYFMIVKLTNTIFTQRLIKQ